MDSVKQSAALCLLRLYRTSPDLVPMGDWTSRVVHLLNDQHLVNASERESTPDPQSSLCRNSHRDSCLVWFLTLSSLRALPGGGTLQPGFGGLPAGQTHRRARSRSASREGAPRGVPVCASQGWDGGALWSCLISVCMATHGPGPTVLFWLWMKTGSAECPHWRGHTGVDTGRWSPVGAGVGQSGFAWPEFCCLAYGHTTLNAPDFIRILLSK